MDAAEDGVQIRTLNFMGVVNAITILKSKQRKTTKSDAPVSFLSRQAAHTYLEAGYQAHH